MPKPPAWAKPVWATPASASAMTDDEVLADIAVRRGIDHVLEVLATVDQVAIAA